MATSTKDQCFFTKSSIDLAAKKKKLCIEDSSNCLFILTEGTKERVVKFAETPYSYVDPSVLSNLTEQFLLLDFKLGQNSKYFEDYVDDIRDILNFSEETKRNGSDIISSMKSYSNSMCVHVRMTDFIKNNWHSDMNITVQATCTLANRQNITHFPIFGDDIQFMINMSQVIVKNGGFNSDAVIVSNYEESIDMYLASKMCKSFLISAPKSTFGWWLAFFVEDQNAVFYLNFARPNVAVRTKEYFMNSWHLYTD